MLNLKNKILIKSISLILAQVFLFTGIVYQGSTTNKNTSSIYIRAKHLRVPMMGARNVAEINAYFNTDKTAHFSLRSNSNSLTSGSVAVTTDRFQIGNEVYAVSALNADSITQLGDQIGDPIALQQNGQNIAFTIRGPTSKAKVADYLRNNPAILQAAIARSESLKYDGTLNENITIILADKYDYLAGDHKQNNIIILNASDLEAMLTESPVFVSEFITSILSEELAHERGADGRDETEEKLALDAGYNTKAALKSQANPRPLSEYIKFVETIGLNIDGETGYLNYLKALNRYKDLDWTARNAPLVNSRTVVIAHMEMGLSKMLLENLYRKLISEKGYSEQAAELEVGEIAKLTMAGGLGNIKRELTEAWAEKGADLVSMNILYGKWIKGVGFVGEDNVRHLLETLGGPVEQFDAEIFDRNNVWQKIKVKVSVYRDPFSPFPNYWIYCPEIFDGAYPDGKEHLGQQLLLYRKASLKLLEILKEKGKVKDKFLFSLSEVYTALLAPEAINDEFKNNPIFKDAYIHHYNHTVVSAGMPELPASLYGFIGFNTERYGSSIVEGGQIMLARIIGREAHMITGCSVAHTDVLRKNVMKDYRDKILENISEENSEGVYLDNWQGEEIQKIIAKYYVRLGARDDTDLFQRLDNSAGLREQFIDDLMSAIEKQKNKSILWFNREDVDLNKDSALISLTRRIVPYKKLDVVVEMLKNPAYRERFIKLGISIIVGGRKFDRNEQDFGITQIRTLEKLVEKYPELKKCVAIVLDDPRHAGYNIFIAPRIYSSVDATIMFSDRGLEAGPTSPSKGLANGGAIIAVKDGVLPEILIPFNSNTGEGNGFEVKYEEDGKPSVESLFKALEDFSAVYKDTNLRRSLAYNALKTGMLKANISTRQGPGLIKLWQEGLEKEQPGQAKLASNENINREILTDFLNNHRDVFIKFEDAENVVQRLIEDGKEFTVVMFDGNSIKKRNEAFGKRIVDRMLFEMAEAFYETAELLGRDPYAIDMKVFRRGGDEFGFIIQADGLEDSDIKMILELARISLPMKIKSKYGLFIIDTKALDRGSVISNLSELKAKGVVMEFEEVGESINVLYASDKADGIEYIKNETWAERITKMTDEFVLTGSMGGLYVNKAVLMGIKRQNKEINLSSIMGGVNYSLLKAKEVVAKAGNSGRKKGNRVYIFRARESEEVDAREWFHNKEKTLAVFKDTETQNEIERVFSESVIQQDKRDKQVPIAYSEQALREMMMPEPSGTLISIDVLWGNPKFDEKAEQASRRGEIHKGRSYLKNFYKFSMLNEALPEKMYDADWVIRVLGYVIKDELEKVFGKGFEVVMARAPPGQSPERFLLWIKPAKGGEVAIDNLEELITKVGNRISEITILKPMIAATVVPIQDTLGHTFGAIDNLSKLYVDNTSQRLDMDVAAKFKGAFLKEGKNVKVTQDGHSIVSYDGSSLQENAMLKFIELQHVYALKDLRDAVPGQSEVYVNTLRRLYADIKDIPRDSPEAKNIISDGISFDEARQEIIDAIKQKRLPGFGNIAISTQGWAHRWIRDVRSEELGIKRMVSSTDYTIQELRKIGEGLKLDPDFLYDLEIALLELLTNSVKYGVGTPRFYYRVSGDSLEIVARNKLPPGKKFDINSKGDVLDPLAPENLLKTHGRGIFYIRNHVSKWGGEFRQEASNDDEVAIYLRFSLNKAVNKENALASNEKIASHAMSWELSPLDRVEPLSGVNGKVCAVGDTHGDLDGLRDTLEDLGLIKKGSDENGLADQWIAEKGTRLIQGGDVIERGPKSIEAIKYLRYLQDRASGQGSEVIRIIGNHELLYLLRHAEGKWAGQVERLKKRGNIRGFDEKFWANDEELIGLIKEDIREGRLIGVYELGGTVFSHGVIMPTFEEDLKNEVGWSVSDPVVFADTVNKILRNAIETNNYDSFIFGIGFSFHDYSYGITGYYFSKLDERDMDKFSFPQVVFHDPTPFSKSKKIGVKKAQAKNISVVDADVGMAPYYKSGRGAVVFENGIAMAAYPAVRQAEDLNGLLNSLSILLESLDIAFNLDTFLSWFDRLDNSLELSKPEDIESFKLIMDGLDPRTRARIAYNIERFEVERSRYFLNLKRIFGMPDFYENDVLARLSVISYMATHTSSAEEIAAAVTSSEGFQLTGKPEKKGEDYIFRFRKENNEYVIRLKKDFSLALDNIRPGETRIITVNLWEQPSHEYVVEITDNAGSIFNSIGYGSEWGKGSVVVNLASGSNTIAWKSFINVDRANIYKGTARFLQADYLEEGFMEELQGSLKSGEKPKAVLLYNAWDYITLFYTGNHLMGLKDEDRQRISFEEHFSNIWKNIVPDDGDFVFVDYMPPSARDIDESQEIVLRVEELIKDKGGETIASITRIKDAKSGYIIGLAVKKKNLEPGVRMKILQGQPALREAI